MRRPVIEEGREPYRAYQQDFKPMPTNYDDIGNAQARAALMQGEMAVKLGELGGTAATTVQKINRAHNKVRLAAKEAEVRSWLGGRFADAKNRNLTMINENGVYGYTTEMKDFDNEWRKFEAEINKRLPISDPAIAEEWRIKRMGILSQHRDAVRVLIDNAKDIVAGDEAVSALLRVTNREQLDTWYESAKHVLPPGELNGKYHLKIQELGVQDAQTWMIESPDNWSNKNVLRRIEELKGNDEFTPETKASIISRYRAFMAMNSDEAIDAINSVTYADESTMVDPETGKMVPISFEDTVWEVTNRNIDAGNITPKEGKATAEAAISTEYKREFHKDLTQARKNGDMAEVARIGAEMNAVSERIHSAEFSKLANDINEILQTNDWNKLDEYLVGQATTKTRVGADGELVREYDGSISAKEIKRISHIFFEGSDEEALQWGVDRTQDGWQDRAWKRIELLRNRALLGAEIEKASYENITKLSDKDIEYRLAVLDPSTLRSAVGDRSTLLSAQDKQNAFDEWSQNQIDSANDDIQFGEYKEVSGMEMDAGTELLLSQRWLQLTGEVPIDYANHLTKVATEGANSPAHGPEAALAAMNALMSLYMTDSSILAQDGFKETGVTQAFELAEYVMMRGGDPEAITEFMENLKRIKSDPLSAKRKLEDAEIAMAPNGEWERIYAGLVEASDGTLPAELPGRMVGDMRSLLKSGYATSAVTVGFALKEVYALAQRKWAPEMRGSIDNPSKQVPTWVYMSIHAEGNHSASSGMDQGVTEEGQTFWDALFGERSAKEHLIDITIQDFLAAEGKSRSAPYVAQYVEQESKRTESNPRGGGWMIMNPDTGLPYLIQDEFSLRQMEASPHNDDRFAIWLGPDTLSLGAQELKTVINNRAVRTAAAKAYDDWATSTGMGDYGNRADQSAISALGADVKKMWMNVISGEHSETVNPDDIPPSAEERHLMRSWNDAMAGADEDTLEYLQAKSMGVLLRSRIYRTAVVLGDTKAMEEMRNNTLAIMQNWYKVKDLKIKSDDQIRELVSTLVWANI
jgi:hypothetical protein